VETLDIAWDVLDQCVELFGGVFVFVTLSLETDTDSVWYVTDTLRPDVLVQALVYSVVCCAHHQVGKLHALLDSSRCPLLETNALDSLVHVNGALDGVCILCG